MLEGLTTFALRGVAAIIVAADGRYLLQLRDDTPQIHMPDNWALFGGLCKPGEPADKALLRELQEELSFTPRGMCYFTETIYIIPETQSGPIHKTFFVVDASNKEIAAMTLSEGQEKRLFAFDAILNQPRFVPWDIFAVTLHARREEVRALPPGHP